LSPFFLPSGEYDIAVANTAEKIATVPFQCTSVIVRAKSANVGSVFVGDLANPNFELSPDTPLPIISAKGEIILSDIAIKGANVGDGVTFVWIPK